MIRLWASFTLSLADEGLIPVGKRMNSLHHVKTQIARDMIWIICKHLVPSGCLPKRATIKHTTCTQSISIQCLDSEFFNLNWPTTAPRPLYHPHNQYAPYPGSVQPLSWSFWGQTLPCSTLRRPVSLAASQLSSVSVWNCSSAPWHQMQPQLCQDQQESGLSSFQILKVKVHTDDIHQSNKLWKKRELYILENPLTYFLSTIPIFSSDLQYGKPSGHCLAGILHQAHVYGKPYIQVTCSVA